MVNTPNNGKKNNSKSHTANKKSKKPQKPRTRAIKKPLTDEEKDLLDGLDLDDTPETGGTQDYKFRGSEALKMKKGMFLSKLIANFGNVTRTCEQLGIRRKRHYHRMTTDHEYKRAVTDIGEICVDYAESALFAHMAQSYQAVIFYLKTRARHRGYVEPKEPPAEPDPLTIIFDGGPNNFIQPLEIEHEEIVNADFITDGIAHGDEE